MLPFFNAQYGESLRKLLSDGQHLRHVVHFGDEQIFPGATNYVCLLFLDKAGVETCRWVKTDNLSEWLATYAAPVTAVPSARLGRAEWNIVVGCGAALFEKLQAMPVKLEQITDRIFQGIKTSADKIYILEELRRERGKVRVFSREKEAEYLLEPDLLHLLIKGGDSRRYRLSKTNRLILFPYAKGKDNKMRLIPRVELQQRLPMTWQYLSDNRPILEQREDGAMNGENWYAYGRTQALNVMPLPKLFTPDIAPQSAFSYDQTGEMFFTGGVAGGYGILAKSPYQMVFVLGLLNSRLLDFYLHHIATQMRGGWFSYEARFIRQLPICPIDFPDKTEQAVHDVIVNLVDKIMAAKKSDPSADTRVWEREVDERVYRLYELTKEEIAIVEGQDV